MNMLCCVCICSLISSFFSSHMPTCTSPWSRKQSLTISFHLIKSHCTLLTYSINLYIDIKILCLSHSPHNNEVPPEEWTSSTTENLLNYITRLSLLNTGFLCAHLRLDVSLSSGLRRMKRAMPLSRSEDNEAYEIAIRQGQTTTQSCSCSSSCPGRCRWWLL